MGNTILAHALFACNKADIDLDNFFGNGGNSHAIQEINSSILKACHLLEEPDSALECILEVIATDWWEVLRMKMSYHKWYGYTPTVDNAFNFYRYHNDPNQENIRLWQDFYRNYKDPSWPDCYSYNDVKILSLEIQNEINSVYVVPTDNVLQTEFQFVEWLSKNYYDGFVNHCPVQHFESAKVMLLGNYLQGNFSELTEICTKTLNWSWDNTRSQKFYNKVLEINQPYLIWIEKIKQATTNIIQQHNIIEEFGPWEQAIIIAKVCELTQHIPENLNWNNIGRITDKKNLYLDILKEINYG